MNTRIFNARKICTTLILLISLVLFTGCGSSGSDAAQGSGSDATQDKDEEITSEEDAPSKASGSDAKGYAAEENAGDSSDAVKDSGSDAKDSNAAGASGSDAKGSSSGQNGTDASSTADHSDTGVTAPDPEFSYEGTTLIVDGSKTDIRDFAPASNAIMDCLRVGDWLLVECHNNPNISTYLLFNIYDDVTDGPKYAIDGADLIWQDDDLSTSVYRQYNEIYDFWGNQIGYIENGQLYELSFKDSNTIAAKCWVIDENGKELDFTEEFEYEPCDQAVLLYYEYLLGNTGKLEQIRELAGKAAALVIVNPPENILEKMPSPLVFEKGALDKIAVIPLIDDARIRIRSTGANTWADGSTNDNSEAGSGASTKDNSDPGSGASTKDNSKAGSDASTKDNSDSGSGASTGGTEKVAKGNAAVFEVTVPEGMPYAAVDIEAPGHEKATWDIFQISGRSPQMSTVF